MGYKFVAGELVEASSPLEKLEDIVEENDSCPAAETDVSAET
jgi:hypothetical protein